MRYADPKRAMPDSSERFPMRFDTCSCEWQHLRYNILKDRAAGTSEDVPETYDEKGWIYYGSEKN